MPYAAFVAPALLATAMMNSALEETTQTVYGKLAFDRYYHSLLVTPVTTRGMVAGELLWAVLRALITGVGFLVVIVVFGLARSPLVILAVPAGLLTAFAFGAAGLAAAAYAARLAQFPVRPARDAAHVPVRDDLLSRHRLHRLGAGAGGSAPALPRDRAVPGAGAGRGRAGAAAERRLPARRSAA